MKEQRTKQILIYLAASLGCFWLGNRVGLLYVSAAGTVTQRLAAAVNLSKLHFIPCSYPLRRFLWAVVLGLFCWRVLLISA